MDIGERSSMLLIIGISVEYSMQSRQGRNEDPKGKGCDSILCSLSFTSDQTDVMGRDAVRSR